MVLKDDGRRIGYTESVAIGRVKTSPEIASLGHGHSDSDGWKAVSGYASLFTFSIEDGRRGKFRHSPIGKHWVSHHVLNALKNM